MARPKDPVNRDAKRQMMTAYFDAAIERVDFLDTLHVQGRDTEALTLCLVYIDGFAQLLYWPRNEVGRNFVDALCTFDPEQFLCLVHPLQVSRALGAMKEPWRTYAGVVSSIHPGPIYGLLEVDEFLKTVDSKMTASDISALKQELWRGTIAAVAYYWWRNPSIHGYGAAPTLGFGQTTRQGKPAPALTLLALTPALRRMIEEARARSLAADEWFGNDRIVFDP